MVARFLTYLKLFVQLPIPENNGVPKHSNYLTTPNGLLYQLHDIIHDVWEFTHEENQLKYKYKVIVVKMMLNSSDDCVLMEKASQ
jgi:hypothetical protein